MTTYTGTRNQIASALAEVLDWTPELRAEYGDMGALATAICAHLVATVDSATRCAREPHVSVPKRAMRDATRHAAIEAGRRLGQVRTDYLGNECGPCAPAPSRLARLQALAAANVPR